VAAYYKVDPDLYPLNKGIMGSNITSVMNVYRQLLCTGIVLCTYIWVYHPSKPSYKLSQRFIFSELLLNYARRVGLQNISYARYILIGQSTPQNFASRNGDKK
jgi:hypothetical protein